MANPVKIFGRHALPLMPGLTRDCVSLLWQIPARAKTDAALYRRVLERHYPALARIPFCSHGELLPGARLDLRYRLLSARSSVVQHPRIGEWLRRAGITPDDAAEPAIVPRALEDVVLDEDRLNADGIRRLRAAGPDRNPTRAMARELVFYWHAWQSTMTA